MTLERRFVLLRALRWAPLGVLMPIMVLVPLDRGLDLPAVGVAFAVHSAVAMVLEVPSGWLADTVGRKRVLLAGGALMAASLAAFAAASSVLAFAGTLAALAAGRALISGSLEAWFVDALRERDPDAALHGGMAAGTAAEGLAMAAGAIAGGALPALTGSFTPAIVVSAGVAVVYVLAVAALIDEVRPRERTQPAPDARTLAVLRARPQVRLLLLLIALFGIAQSGIELLWQPRTTDLLGGDAIDGTLLLGGLTAASMVAVAAGAMASRLTYAAAMAAAAVAVAGLALAGGVVVFAIAYLAWYAALGAVDPVHAAALHDAVPSETRATLASVDGLAHQSGGLAGNLGLPTLAAAAGAPWGFAAAAGFLALGALLARKVTPAASRTEIAGIASPCPTGSPTPGAPGPPTVAAPSGRAASTSS